MGQSPSVGIAARSAAAIALLPLITSACASSRSALVERDQVEVSGKTFVIEHGADDGGAARDVKAVLPAVLPVIDRWGAFSTSVVIRIRPSHSALETAVGRSGLPWLRAWARFDTIDLQSPRTWGATHPSLGQIAEILAHELTHCLMYQRVATESTWEGKTIPLWFREGMASVTSHQEYRRPDDRAVWKYLLSHEGDDPLADAERLSTSEQAIVYGAAHDAFAFLEKRYGDAAITSVLDRMRSGDDFGAAFRAAVGIEVDAFVREYLRYVRWEGWREAPPSP